MRTYLMTMLRRLFRTREPDIEQHIEEHKAVAQRKKSANDALRADVREQAERVLQEIHKPLCGP